MNMPEVRGSLRAKRAGPKTPEGGLTGFWWRFCQGTPQGCSQQKVR